MSKKTITEKDLLFVHEYIRNGFNGTQAYMVAFELAEEQRESAAKGAYRLLKNPFIQEAIDQEEGSYRALAREMAMNRKEILEELQRIIWGKSTVLTKAGMPIEIENDGKTKVNAINTLVKLTGDFSPEKKEIDFSTERKIDTKNLSEDEIKALQATLLGEL